MSNKYDELKYNIRVKAVVNPLDKGFCKHCMCRQRDSYCHKLDTACDKVYICRSYIYTARKDKE